MLPSLLQSTGSALLRSSASAAAFSLRGFASQASANGVPVEVGVLMCVRALARAGVFVADRVRACKYVRVCLRVCVCVHACV